MLEAVFVVLGVILALAANEWLQYSNQKAEAEAAIVSIHDEIQVNHMADGEFNRRCFKHEVRGRAHFFEDLRATA